ncbi:hypothetical protein ES703_84851 [subsurface metagenome]
MAEQRGDLRVPLVADNHARIPVGGVPAQDLLDAHHERAYLLLCIVLHNRGVLAAGLTTEVVIDASFYLVGLVAVLWWFTG